MEVFMLTVQIFAAGYLPGADIRYNATQIPQGLRFCQAVGQQLVDINDLSHGDKARFQFKCILRQGV